MLVGGQYLYTMGIQDQPWSSPSIEVWLSPFSLWTERYLITPEAMEVEWILEHHLLLVWQYSPMCRYNGYGGFGTRWYSAVEATRAWVNLQSIGASLLQDVPPSFSNVYCHCLFASNFNVPEAKVWSRVAPRYHGCFLCIILIPQKTVHLGFYWPESGMRMLPF